MAAAEEARRQRVAEEEARQKAVAEETKRKAEEAVRLAAERKESAEIRIEAKGQTLTVSLNPASAEIQRLAEQSRANFASALAERIPSFQVSVFINPKSASRKNLVDETA